MLKQALVLAGVIALVGVATPWTARPVVAENTEAAGATQDVLVLDSGMEVRGKIIEETATEIVMNVTFRGISTRTTYLKSEVLEIKRDVPASNPSKPASFVDDDDEDADDKEDSKARPAWFNDETAQLYVAELKGFMGRDITETPFNELFEDVDRQFDDLVQVPGSDEYQVRPDRRDKNIVVIKMDCTTDLRRGFDGLFTAEQLAPTIKREKRKGRRIVFWVENAGGGAAFLAFMSPEIYMTRDGWMGGVGTLDDFDIGDTLVNEKQISLRLGHAEGLALEGGYGEVGVKIVRAMARKQFWFAAKPVGGEFEVILEDPRENPELHGGGWTILSDDGDGDNKDDKDALRGNDVLVLEADWAAKLGMSQGIADDVDELQFALGLDDNYWELPDTRAEKILEGWMEEIENVIRQINPGDNGRPRGDLWDKFDDVPKYAKSAAQGLGQQIRILRQIHSLVGRYAEVFDPSGGWRGQLELQIEELRQQAERNRRSESQRNSRRNNRGPVPR